MKDNCQKEVLVFGLSTNHGGIETYLLKIATHINKNKFHLNFIDMTGEGNRPFFYQELKMLGCTFYKVTPRRISIFENRRDLRKLFQENKFDVFHFNVNTLSYIYPLQVAVKEGIYTIIHSRSSNAQLGSFTRFAHQLNRLKVLMMPITRIAVSEAAGKWLYGKSAYTVYHNGVETEKYKYTHSNRIRVRSEMSCDDKYIIGHVGAMLPVKNHHFMIDAFERFNKLEPNSVLWFIGDGPLRKEIQNLVQSRNLQDRVCFLGTRSDLPDLYAAMDVLWLPSEYEGYPNVVLEGFCSGLPVLVSDKVPKDVLIGDIYEVLSLDDDLQIWAKKLNDMCHHKESERESAYLRMNERGASVGAEIERIESLYMQGIT